MSGKLEVCSACGGEIKVYPYESGKYTISGGWCPQCNRPTLIVPEQAYDDEEYDVESETVIVAKKVRDSNYREFKIIDTPEFQFKWTASPNDEISCASCKHGYRVVIDGEDLGQGCRLKKESEERRKFKFCHVCDEYTRRDVWYNMGNHCRWCYWAYVKDGQLFCHTKNSIIKDISEYDRGHCTSYQRMDSLWGFECKGMVECPSCGKMAKITRYRGERRCMCGFRWAVEE